MEEEEVTTVPMPERNQIAFSDLQDVLALGWRDFTRAPLFGILFGCIFALGGLMIWLQLALWGQSWKLLPLAVGFPLIAPFVAVGLYEISRELEQGRRPDWPSVVRVMLLQRGREIPWMAFVVLFFFGVWTWLAHLIFALFFGLSRMTNVMSSFDIYFTAEGMTMLATGTLVGAVLAFLLFSITVVSIPLLLDRDNDFVTAMISSVAFVLENKVVMLVWAAIVAVLSILAMIPLFAGLLVVLPVLGHSTWHLYRKAFAEEPNS